MARLVLTPSSSSSRRSRLLSLYLHRGSASVYDFTEEALRDKAVLDLAARVGYEQVPETAEFAVRLILRNGRTVEAPFRYSRGLKPEPEMLNRRLEKFASLTKDRLNESGRTQMMEMVDKLEAVRDVAEWTTAIHRLFRPVKNRA